jgi:hypothetical protein
MESNVIGVLRDSQSRGGEGRRGSSALSWDFT